MFSNTKRRDGKIAMLDNIHVFRSLKRDELTELGRQLDVVDVEAGRRIIIEGSNAYEFFIIVEGAAAVERDGQVIAMLGAGDIVGEIALITGEERNASVVASSAMRLLVGERRAFRPLMDRYPHFRAHVQSGLAARMPQADVA